MYVIVVGGGKLGYYLAKTLIFEGYEVLIVEKNPSKCAVYEERFGAAVMQGDGAEAATLKEAGAGRADVVIATTGDDEDNLIICQVAKRRFEVRRTMARVNNPKNEALFKRLGVDVTVSQTNVILSLIEQQIPERHFAHLMTLKHADLAIVEAGVLPNSPVVGKTVADIQVPDVVVSAVIRGSDVIIPNGQTRIQAGDEVIAVTRQPREAELRELIVGA
jgi:trk system potassium uptake protein TrkA